MESRILLGTNNPDKLTEIQRLLSDFNVTIVSLSDMNCHCEVEETGKNYEENAILKATTFSRVTGMLCISDDSGLEVDALEGQPGVYSSRWANPRGQVSYEANNRKLLEQMQQIPLEKRSARFVCVVALVQSQDVLICCRGTCEGRIALSPRGKYGFGYDPLFEVPEYGKTFAELGEIKDKISHRSRALQQFRERFAALNLTMLN